MDYSIKKNSAVLLKTIFENIPQYIFWKDKESIYLGCNDNYAKLIGLNTPEEIVGKTDEDIGWLPDGDTAKIFRQGDQRIFDGGQIANEEEWLSLPGGKKIFTLISKVALTDDDGFICGVLGVATDITEKNKIEKDYQKTRHQLKGMTITGAAVAHELRTPLASIKSSSRGIEKMLLPLIQSYRQARASGMEVPHLADSKLDLLEEVTRNLSKKVDQSNMVIDILLVNMSINETQKNNLKQCSAFACVEKALKQYVFLAGQKSKVHWVQTHDFSFMGEEILLVHIFFNLLKNALYFISKAGKGEIFISFESKENVHLIYFKDTAYGIKKEYQDNIFEQFYTAETAKGTGIGLAFCKSVMNLFKGDISCTSQFGEYTQFTMVFPKM